MSEVTNNSSKRPSEVFSTETTVSDQLIQEAEESNDNITNRFKQLSDLNHHDEYYSDVENEINMTSNLGCNHSLKKIS